MLFIRGLLVVRSRCCAWKHDPAWKRWSFFRMLDAIVICVFLAMVLTPAVVAARCGEGPNTSK
jgi:hypothetical protein